MNRPLDVVRELTGAPAQSFETTARRYAAMPFAKPTFGNKLKAFLNFNLSPFYFGYDLEKWDREMRFPVPPVPSLSIDDPRWRNEHVAPIPAAPPAGVSTTPSRDSKGSPDDSPAHMATARS